MTVHNLYAGSWLSNCYILISKSDDGTLHAAAIDPSAPANKIIDYLNLLSAKLDMVILTHGHFDHIMSLDDLCDATNAPAYIHEQDAEMLQDSVKNAYSFFFDEQMTVNNAVRTLNDGDKLTLGNEELAVIHLPGHSKGSIALLSGNIMLTGDTLFDGGIGRSDLYGGDQDTLYASLLKLSKFDRDIIIYPGHGTSARLGDALDLFL